MKRNICLLSLIGLLLVGTGCGNTDKPTATSHTTTSSTTTPNAGTETAVRVYFVRADKICTAGRNTTEANTKEQAVQALLAGPNDFERGIGMSTAIPAGTKLNSINVAGGTATVDLSKEFTPAGEDMGTAPMQQRVGQVVFTLTQFNDVQNVTITVDGRPVEGAANLKRSGLEGVVPRILIESPVPGQPVTSPLQVSGIAHVFEGNVTYSVNDPDGKVLAYGATTVGQSDWNWYPFTFTATYTTPRPGLGRVIAWEVSQADGSKMNPYEVPVNMS